jgi:hypothetical protein
MRHWSGEEPDLSCVVEQPSFVEPHHESTKITYTFPFAHHLRASPKPYAVEKSGKNWISDRTCGPMSRDTTEDAG